MAQNTKNQEVSPLGDSLFNIWSNSLDKVFNAQEEIENLLLQALESQKETWGKVTEDLAKIEEEQKKLTDELRESAKLNIQKLFGPSASRAFEQWNAQLDEVTNRVQSLTETPYKEGVKLFSQSHEQFQQSIKDGIDQQQKFRGDISDQIKTTQKMLLDLYESNSKLTLSLFK